METTEHSLTHSPPPPPPPPLIVKPSATPDEIQEVVNSGQGATVFAQQVSGTHVNEAKRALLDIHKRHAEVQRLEESILVNFLIEDKYSR